MADAHSTPGTALELASPPPAGERLATVVEQLCAANNDVVRRQVRDRARQALPSREELADVVEALRTVLFPGYYGTSEIAPDSMRFYIGATLDEVMRKLRVQILRGMCSVCARTEPDCQHCDDPNSTRHGTLLGCL